MIKINNKILQGKTAWITGGRRIGRKVAEVLAQNGCNIILSYNTSKKEAQSTEKRLKRFKIKTLILKCDVSSRKSVMNAVDEIKAKFKKMDILVLMASVFEKKELKYLTEQDFKKNFDVHVLGTLFPIQSCLGIMPKGSHIITVSDAATIKKHYEGYLPYLVSKNAVNYLTKALSGEIDGIYINTVAPGPVLKPDNLDEKRWKEIKKELNYSKTDKEAVEQFAKLVLKLSTIKSTGKVYFV